MHANTRVAVLWDAERLGGLLQQRLLGAGSQLPSTLTHHNWTHARHTGESNEIDHDSEGSQQAHHRNGQVYFGFQENDVQLHRYLQV